MIKAIERQIKETERALAILKAKKTELTPGVEASREEMHVAEDRASIATVCALSLEVKEERKAASSEEDRRVEAQERLHKDQADRVRELEDQIKRLARLQ